MEGKSELLGQIEHLHAITETLKKEARDARLMTLAANMKNVLLVNENEKLKLQINRLQEKLTQYWGEVEDLKSEHRREVVDITARSIEGRMEAWDLIDKLIPYAKLAMPEEYDPAVDDLPAFNAGLQSLLDAIEEKRAPHG